MARLFEKERRCHEPAIEAYGHVLLQVSFDRIPTWRAHLISNSIVAASCLNIRPSYRRASLYDHHQPRLPHRQSRYNPTRTRNPRRWIRRRCSGRDHFLGVKQGLDVCRCGGMAKCSRLVSFLYIYFLKKIFFMSTFIQTTLPTTRLKTLSKRSHASSRPVTSSFLVPRLVTLHLRL